jgi:L-alanine-DL-glutamate epimerase-like enolase superfamily enzyme
VNAVIGAGSTEDAVKRSRAAVHAGFTCLKLKLTDPSSSTVQRVAAVRAAIGSEPRLRLDANACWSFEQADSVLTQCAAYDIQYVEQPLPVYDLAGMARLRRVSPIPLAVDEALTGLESARRVLDAEAADVLILKPQLAGGLRAGRQIIQESSQRNVVCVVTSTLEAGIGVAAALHLAAASPEITMACGLATLDLLVDDLLCDGLLVSNGHIHVPAGPGLGVQLDEAALKCYTA